MILSTPLPPTIADDIGVVVALLTMFFWSPGLFFVPFRENGSLHVSGDEDGPFRFDCNALEVKLSPRSREREADNTAADVTFEALATEVRVFCSCSELPCCVGAIYCQLEAHPASDRYMLLFSLVARLTAPWLRASTFLRWP